jgi:phosphatidylserine decarboxylase
VTWYRHKYFFKIYGVFPHTLINYVAGRISRAQNPAWLIQILIKIWNARLASKIAQSELKFKTIEAFFLRDFESGQRPFAHGFMSPVDGILMSQGKIESGILIQAKGQDYSIHKLLTEKYFHSGSNGFTGGVYYTLFLTPNGYHGIHMPEKGVLLACQWVPGRYFPQNEEAVKYISRIYEKNERLILKLQNTEGQIYYLIMVGASLIGGIYLRDVPKSTFQKLTETKLSQEYEKGERLGHFTFGSTVILILPATFQGNSSLSNGTMLKMGEALN